MTSYLRDDSKLHNASTFIILLNAFAWVALVVDIGFLILGKEKLIYGAILLGIIIFGIFTDTYYNYYECAKISFDRNKVIFEYKLNSNLMGNQGVKINIKDIKKIKFKRNKAVVYGDIVKKQPMTKSKTLTKVEIPTNFGRDTDKVLENLKTYVGGKL